METELEDFITKLTEDIKNAPKQFIQRTIVDEQARTNILKLYLNDKPTFIRFILNAKSNDVPAKDLKTLENIIKDEFKKKTTNIPILKTKVKSIISDAPIHDGCVLPFNFTFTGKEEIKYEGPGKRHGNIACQYPIFIKDIRKNQSEQLEYVTLTWLKNSKWEEHTDEKKVIAQAKLIADLSRCPCNKSPSSSCHGQLSLTMNEPKVNFRSGRSQNLPEDRIERKMPSISAL